MTATDARVWFGSGGVAKVESSLRLTGHSYLYCHTYDDHAPILSVTDEHVTVSIAVPDTDQVTAEDLAVARELADTVARYVTELEKLAALADYTAGTDDRAGQAA